MKQPEMHSVIAISAGYLAVQRVASGASSLLELVRSGGSLGLNPNGSTAAYFTGSNDQLATQLTPRCGLRWERIEAG